MELNLGQRILVKLAECTIIGFLENHQLFKEKQLGTLIACTSDKVNYRYFQFSVMFASDSLYFWTFSDVNMIEK